MTARALLLTRCISRSLLGIFITSHSALEQLVDSDAICTGRDTNRTPH